VDGPDTEPESAKLTPMKPGARIGTETAGRGSQRVIHRAGSENGDVALREEGALRDTRRGDLENSGTDDQQHRSAH
jgi:hypothetical protein